MNNSVLTMRSSERTILSNLDRIVKNCKEWLNTVSVVFSAYMRETVTRLQVVLTQVILIMIIGATVAVNSSFSLALLFLVCAAWATWLLNETEKGGEL